MTATGKRVLIYTTALLTFPLPMMAVVEGEPAYPLSMLASSAILTPVSFQVARGLIRDGAHRFSGFSVESKLLIASFGTLCLGLFFAARAVWILAVHDW